MLESPISISLLLFFLRIGRALPFILPFVFYFYFLSLSDRGFFHLRTQPALLSLFSDFFQIRFFSPPFFLITIPPPHPQFRCEGLLSCRHLELCVSDQVIHSSPLLTLRAPFPGVALQPCVTKQFSVAVVLPPPDQPPLTPFFFFESLYFHLKTISPLSL